MRRLTSSASAREGRDRLWSPVAEAANSRSEEHTSELQSHVNIVCRLFFLMTPPPPSSTLFPYTTLFRSLRSLRLRCDLANTQVLRRFRSVRGFQVAIEPLQDAAVDVERVSARVARQTVVAVRVGDELPIGRAHV